MKKIFPVFITVLLLYGCKTDKTPDVSGIKVDLQVNRFEKDFFAIDTTNLLPALHELQTRYPGFMNDFVQNILGLPPLSDTSRDVQNAIKKFLSDYRSVKDSCDKIFSSLDNTEKDLEDALRYVKYYFPQYKTPSQLISFIGPMDAYFEGSMGGYGDVLTTEGLATGLQLHLGKDFSLYKSEMGLALFPAYISRRFSPEYIPVNGIKNIIDDLFPDKSVGKTLVEQMIEKGKRLYLLDKLMPHFPDTLKIGYTAKQLDGCYDNEGLIWNFFLKNGLVYNNDPGIIKGYIGDAPNTPELGEASPGNIGMFIGWQIIKKYVDQNPDILLPALMNTDAKKIFEESKYRPK